MHGELQYLRDSWDSVPLSTTSMSSSWEIMPEFIDKRKKKTKKFHDELSTDCRLADPMQAFKVYVFFKLVDVAINQPVCRFDGQQQVAELF